MCPKYFHRVANSHRRNIDIVMLNIDGIVSSDHLEIRHHVVLFCEHLLNEDIKCRQNLMG